MGQAGVGLPTLTPTTRCPVERRTRVTLRNLCRPVAVIVVMAFHSGRMQPVKSAWTHGIRHHMVHGALCNVHGVVHYTVAECSP